MGGEWEVKALDQLGRIVTGKTPPSSVADAFGGHIPFVTPSDMNGARIISTTTRSLSSSGRSSVRNATIPKNAVMVSCIGSDMGKAAIAGADGVTNQQINSIIIETDDSPLFVYYNLSTRKAEIRGSASGSAQPILNKSAFGRLEMELPSPAEQRAIAHILGTLDDKIELNRRRNQTLEAMARALFKDWFIDFGPVRAKMEGQQPYLPVDLWQLFPERLDDEDKPEGWEIQPLDQIAALVTNSIAPGKTPEAVFEHYSIPAFDVGRMAAMEVGESIKSNKYIVDPDSVLVSKLNPQTPRVWLPAVATDRAICSTEFMQFVPHDRENRSYLYCLMSSGTMQEVVLQHVTGSTGSRQRAQPSQIAKVNILTPSPSVVMAFNRQAGPILKAVGENQRESQNLAQLRDTLLPKLISGELRIADAEKFMERVA